MHCISLHETSISSISRPNLDPYFRGGLADEAVRLFDVEVILEGRSDHELTDDGHNRRHRLEVGEAVSHALSVGSVGSIPQVLDL